MTEKRWLALILILYVLMGIMYAVTTPAFEASDELWHYPMVRHLADGNSLPVQVFDPQLAGPWKQEASQPPLYYYAGAVLTFWIDTSDMAEVRRENFHVDNGILTQDGNRNLVVHNAQQDPWQGTLLALRLVRFMSVLMGLATVYLTYRIAAAAVPGRPEVAIGAAAVNAFLPMFLFISGSVNNDNLAIMLASLALLMMINIVADRDAHTIGYPPAGLWQKMGSWLGLGVVMGLAVLTKQGTIGLFPLAWGTAFVASWLELWEKEDDSNAGDAIRRLLRSLPRSLAYFLLVLLPVAIIAGWWYLRNQQLYGDWLGWSAFIAVLGERAHPASLLQLWGERRGFLMAYWGLFGGVNIPMPAWVYSVFNTLLVFSVIGFLLYALREGRRWLSAKARSWESAGGVAANLMRFLVDHFALVVSLLFSAAVIFGLIRWATTTWSSQGRLVFTALSALSTLFVTGLVGWMPRSYARWATAVVAILFLVVALAAPFLWIKPAYDPDSFYLAQDAEFDKTEIALDEKIRINGTAVALENGQDAVLEPGDAFWVHLDWEPLTNLDEDLSIFVHAVDPILGRPVAQRDMYPGQGLQLTSWLEPGTEMVDSFRVELPDTAVAPAELAIKAGFYNAQTGERLHSSSGADSIDLDSIALVPAEGAYPNPVNIDFEGQLELQGYAIAPRSLDPAEEVQLDLYWRPMQRLEKDYTFFAQIVDSDTTRWASIDLPPAQETSTWSVNETVVMPLILSLAPDTPAGIYPVIVGLYTRDDEGNFERLQLRTADGRLTEDFVELTQIRVQP